jgi:hypothetical protein
MPQSPFSVFDLQKVLISLAETAVEIFLTVKGHPPIKDVGGLP